MHAFLPELVLETLENQSLKTGGTLPSSLSKSGDSFPYMENFEILHETELPFSTRRHILRIQIEVTWNCLNEKENIVPKAQHNSRKPFYGQTYSLNFNSTVLRNGMFSIQAIPPSMPVL